MPTTTDTPNPVIADLEATAELPMIDFNVAADQDETASMFPTSALPDLAESLRDVELHLKRKTERLRALEAQLEAAEAAGKALRADLDRERRSVSEQLATERRSAAELLERERAASAQQLEHERRTATAQLEAERKSAAERIEKLHHEAQAELAGVRTTAQGTATEMGQRLGESEQSLQRTRATHEKTLGELAAAQGRLAEHERLVAELRESTTLQATQLRHHSRDLAELRQRAERQAEALNRSQGSQGVLESLLSDREQAMAGIEATHAEQLAQLTAESARQAQQSLARETSMREQSANTTAAMRAEHERQLAELVARHSAREAELLATHGAREAELIAQHGAREAALLAERAASDTSLKAHHEAQEAQTRAAREATEQALNRELAVLREESSQRILTLEESLHQRTTELEQALQQRTTALAEALSRADAAERTVAEQSARLESAQQERQVLRDELGLLRATDAAAKAGVARFDEQRQQIEELEFSLGSARQLAERLEADLVAARGNVQRLEADARVRTSLLGNLQQNMARLSREDSGIRPGPRMAAAGSPLPDRMLIGQQDGEYVMHSLGRRSTIGRTADNQIQIDASHVSRHHAVILGSEQNCVIEDLKSTNGILVNGKRVARQALNDGDIVRIGQSTFRYRQTS